MKLHPNEIKNIIVFRALQLGDLLCAVPAFKALRAAYPKARITLAGLPWQALFVERFSNYFDDFIWFPGYPGLPEQAVNASAFVSFLSTVQNQHYDLALQMQGNGTIVNAVVELFGAHYTAGFYLKGDYTPSEHLFLEYPDHGSEVEGHLQLMAYMGIPSQGSELEFPLTDEDEADYAALSLPLKSQQYVCIHPGSRGSWRQWPTENFAKIADYCAGIGYKIVLTGTAAETDIVAEVQSKMNYAAINTAGKTSLGAIAILIRNAFALVSNCTGVSHIAAAFKTRSIVISMDGEPERWGPANKQLHYTINWLDNDSFDNVAALTAQLMTYNPLKVHEVSTDKSF
jgi:ADP-heptose:LPS heptosyltransferase